LFFTVVVATLCYPLTAQTVSGLKYREYYSKDEIINTLGEPDRYECFGEYENAYLVFVYGENKFSFDFPYPNPQYEEVTVDNTTGYKFVWSENDKPFITEKGRFTQVILKNPGSMIEFPSCCIRVGDSFDRLLRQRIGLQTLGKTDHYCAVKVFSEESYIGLGIKYGSIPIVEELTGFWDDYPPMDLNFETAKSVDSVRFGSTRLSVGDTLHFNLQISDIEFHSQEPDICRVRRHEDTWVTYRMKYDEKFIIRKIERIEELPFHF